MADAIGPFLRELREKKHLFEWELCTKTGRILGWHKWQEYDAPFTPMQVVAWKQEGEWIENEYAAARAVGMESIAHAMTECCNHFSRADMRKAVLVEIGLVDAK